MTTTVIETSILDGKFRLGQQVWVVQRTKQQEGTIKKLNPRRAIVEIGGRRYRVSYKILSHTRVEDLELYWEGYDENEGERRANSY